jgi:hypothetical protein
MALKYTKIFYSKACRNISKLGFWRIKIYHLATLLPTCRNQEYFEGADRGFASFTSISPAVIFKSWFGLMSDAFVRQFYAESPFHLKEIIIKNFIEASAAQMPNLNFTYIDVGSRVWCVMKKQLFSLRKLPCDWEVRGHCMCKEMPVIPVNRMVDMKRIIRKMEGWEGGEAQRVADPKKIYIGRCVDLLD